MAFTSVLLAVLIAAAQQPQRPNPTPVAAAQTATLRGRVIAQDSGQPLRKAQVRLNQIDAPFDFTSGPGRQNQVTTTGADGRYEFTNLPAGRYNVTASKGAFITVSWGQQRPMESSKPIDLAPGQNLERVDFSLLRGGVIAGRIVDEFGEPLAGLELAAMRSVTINGKRDLQQTESGSTDDLGEFRLFGLAPGQYAVRATWQRLGPGDPRSPDRTGYAPTFFPGTTDAAHAQRFTVAANQTISDLVMALSPIRTVRVEGTVVDSGGRPMGGTSVAVAQASGGRRFISGGNMTRPDGMFTLANLTPGEYILMTEPSTSRKDVAAMKLTVGTEDIKDLRLVAFPPSLIIGRVIVDPAQAQSLGAAPITLAAAGDDAQMMRGFNPSRVGDDLSFELPATPGRNRINPMNLPAGWTIRSVRANNIDVTNDGIEVKPGENVTGVEVELTNRLATISGLVKNARGETSKDYTVVLFALDTKSRPATTRYWRIARPDQDGRFKMSGMLPADYSIVAIATLEMGQAYDAEFLERIQPAASRVTIREGETQVLDLKLIEPR
jgi:protocatechuate 3,4-dioxygenase beta subunit